MSNINPAIKIEKLHKTYSASGKSEAKTALHSIDLDIPKGSIFGLLGPNGAGKSTIINIMAGLVIKTSGSVNIWDYDIDKNERQAKASIGVVTQEIHYDPFFTPLAMLNIQAGLYGVPKKDRRSMHYLELMGLADYANAYTRTMSGGMRRRLMVAKAMIHNPPILVLDEPTAGVDIELRRQLWDNVKELNKQGTTILLTTHYLEEAEQLCDSIAIINKGNIVANDDTETLLSRIDNKEITFHLDDEVKDMPKGLEKFNAEIIGKNRIRCHYSPSDKNVGKMLETIQKSGLAVNDISTEESDLEDVFLQLTQDK
jgi:ABC-2 type transport system ATP-binding protein